MEFRKMTDSQLAEIMINYILRIDHLRNIISAHMDGRDNGNISAEHIRAEYAQLKKELREDAYYLSLERNREGSNLYTGFFQPSIREAAAWGFTVPSNGAINQRMFGAVSEAHYKMTKYHSFEEWEALL